MPTIETINGVRINIYYGEHLPPHIHVVYNEYEELLEIETFAVYAGSLPVRQHKFAIKWLRENHTVAKDLFFTFNPHLNERPGKNTENIKS